MNLNHFAGHIALEDTALKLSRRKAAGLNDEEKSGGIREEIFIVEARKKLLISIVMSNEENHIILRAPN